MRRDQRVPTVDPDRERAVRLAGERGDRSGLDHAAMPGELIAHAPQQFDAADTVRKARMVVGARDPGGAALPGIDQDEPASESSEIDRGRQSARTAPNDDAVQRAPVIPPSRLAWLP